jgi:thymidylate kinase
MRNLGAEPVLIRIEIDPKVAADRQILHGGETRTDEEKLAGLKNVEKEMEEPPQSEGVPVFRINGNKSIAEVTQALKESIATLTVNTVDDNRACS